MSRKQQLRFKDQFLSHVSHELRTPLTGIHEFVGILLAGLAGPLPKEQREHLETVMRSVKQLLAMIGHLLEAARAESGQMRIEPRCLTLDTAGSRGCEHDADGRAEQALKSSWRRRRMTARLWFTPTPAGCCKSLPI